MKKDKTIKVLTSFLRLANCPDDFTFEMKKQVDIFFSLSALILCYPAYELITKGDISLFGLLPLTIGSFFFGSTLMMKFSVSTLKTISPYLNKKALEEAVNNET
ncbi:hypothetical protein [Neptunicella sp.]|uniref:hypothetical protein n=1 Tax=Neptunicella sp. TaxID=2125986 RepID=UPI003F68BEAF